MMTRFVPLKEIGLAVALLLFSLQSQASCVLSIDRTPCPGKEEEARKPYSGKNPTTEQGKAKDMDSCLREGERKARIIRKGTLGKKVVTVKFDDKVIGTKEDAANCNR